jgi:DNA-binding transcriptional ArsR family regulator
MRRKPQEVRIISDLETLRLLTQPLRLRLLEEVRTALSPLTVKELATALGTPQTKLYYHINLLEEAGFLRVASTRVVSGITEKRYEATADRIGVDRSLLAGRDSEDPATDGNQALEVLLPILLDQVRGEIRRSVRAGLIHFDGSEDNKIAPNSLVLGRKWLRLTPVEVDLLEQRMRDLWAGFDRDAEPKAATDADSPPDAQSYEVLIGFYPTVSQLRVEEESE